MGACLVLAAACAMTTKPRPSASRAPPPPGSDLHSFAEPDRVRVRHVSLALDLDFAGRTLRGRATLDFDRPDPDAPLILDNKGLAIERVTGPDGNDRIYDIGRADPVLGTPMAVVLKPSDRSVTITYRTTASAEALQWLLPEQTRDQKDPFLFTQGQAILTRTWIPLQDSPAVRVTFDAKVRAPAGQTVVMGAEQLGQDRDGVWRFTMKEPIPPYLIALASGRLAFEPISARAGVWAEPSLVKTARDELVDTEKMILAAESLFGPYRWGRYDIVILPPAFPYGGMENPRLTFATPTIIAGDKSLVSLVAHELAHSWSGNLVTNATWRDFWLNEGFTTYCEQRIMEKVFGVERSRLEKQLALNDLEDEMDDLEDWQEVLFVDLGRKHPDLAFSGIPYEKGSLFLQRLEQVFGRPRFDAFLRGYFRTYSFKSIGTEDFVKYLQKELLATDASRARQVDVTTWLNRPGLPPDSPRPNSPALLKVEVERERFVGGTRPKSLRTKGWVTQQWQHFIRTLPDTVPLDRLRQLDRLFGFTRSGNSEILADWLVLAIRRDYRDSDERLVDFLLTCGRRKFLKPLYTELAKTKDGLTRARQIYEEARPRYHAVATSTIDKILRTP
jgi:leukotriene-A4 hydrolase